MKRVNNLIYTTMCDSVIGDKSVLLISRKGLKKVEVLATRDLVKIFSYAIDRKFKHVT